MANGKAGRSAFSPTEEQTATARRMLSDGYSFRQIAIATGVSAPTARKAFAGLQASGAGGLFDASQAPSAAPAQPQRRKRVASGGRPQAQRNRVDAGKVALWSAGNVAVRIMAERLGMSEPTLRRLYPDEIEHGPAMKRAEMLERLERTAKGGNVTAQKAMLEIIGRTEEERLADQIRRPAPKDKAVKAPVGKKEQAMVEADDAATTGAFANLLQPATPARH